MSFVSDMPRPGATKADAILEVHALRKAFGPVVAVEDVQFTLGRGEFVTFLGPSGSGKTTTLEMIAGLTRPTSGRIFLNGKPIDPLPPYRRDIGVVFQHYALFPHMTLSRNIAFPLEMRRVPRAEVRRRVGEALELVGLAGYADRLPRELSGGQQQRVALARALVFRPPLLLMDEPLGALDKKLREQMQLEIKQIHRGLDASIVYVTHDQDEALVMSDRIAVFNGGRIEQIGPPEELYDRPKTRFVAGFLGESNFFDGKVASVEGGQCAIATAAGTLRAANHAGLVAGDGASLAVRPERVRLLAAGEPPGDGNVVAGIVTGVIYLGQSRKYRVRTSGGAELFALQQAQDSELRRLEENSRVRLSWRAEQAVALRREPGP